MHLSPSRRRFSPLLLSFSCHSLSLKKNQPSMVSSLPLDLVLLHAFGFLDPWDRVRRSLEKSVSEVSTFPSDVEVRSQ